MGKKLYVGNINFNTNEDMLKTHFETSGGSVLDVRVITDRETGRPRGFAFVTFSSDEEAKTAMEALDGQELDGRQLRVNEAIEKERSGPRGGGGGGGGRGGYDRGGRGGGGGGGRGGYEGGGGGGGTQRW